MTHHSQTHLYGYAVAAKQRQDNAPAMRAKAIRHGHTEGECARVDLDPQRYIATGTLALTQLGEIRPAYRTDLTPGGEQLVIPGCERDAAPKVRQLDLF
jgi:hypothetical protein